MPCDRLVICIVVIVIYLSNLYFTVIIIRALSISNYLRLSLNYPPPRLEGLPQLINQPLLLILLSQQPLLRLILFITIIAIRLHLLLIVVLLLFILAIDGNEYLYLVSLGNDFLYVQLGGGIVVGDSNVSVIVIIDVILIDIVVICDTFFIGVIGYSG